MVGCPCHDFYILAYLQGIGRGSIAWRWYTVFLDSHGNYPKVDP